MRENPNVCVEVEDVDDRFHWTTVVVFGRYDEISDAPKDKDLRERALHLLNDRSRWWLPGAAKPGGAGVDDSVQRDEFEIFSDAEMEPVLREEEQPVEIQPGGESVQSFEKEKTNFQLAAGHGS